MMIEGLIKSVNQEKKYAFIRGRDGIEYFLHKTQFRPRGDGIGFDDVVVGMRAVFDGDNSSRGPFARNVMVASSSSALAALTVYA